MVSSSRGVTVSLTKPDVVRAGVEILDAYGLGDLSMRRVAERLGVKAGALYWHVANKQSLLAAVSDEILAADGGPTAVPSQDTELANGVNEWAQCFRATLRAHRDGAELVASTISVGLGEIDPTVGLRQFIERQGFSGNRADSVCRALVHLVLGHTMEEQTRTQLHDLGVLSEIDSARQDDDFDLALAIFVAGLNSLL
ncbi:TetR family transcriptional regulator [Propionibacterium sp. NM47_B9-13]|uniref:Transcriptional regulator, TetR family n=1 Tax=Cutibacterium modestum HL044PA1 TaxID=765109 RepID=A0ABN0C407_9ACTN|nr:TetR/AcrR family transcriptional regulator C-terminal domain-containing protein [Cutibacterium modestum]EFS74307.1 transcriptional regulator, TetR family [Cutibacterium modestum HL037PA2]EFS91933.1 transcriptional regulator, TetR family [Cutibacterium modestum HL044PA1]EFT16199.1 transcriptional regulator, TetR family [Cutibacterium modestum HL037PA3]TGY28064.1 TetR family transcriptional regulator [Propionibacterium sp. NM47_B9-13]AOH46423.1 TetR family transcriptional regulator [Cutibacte